MAKIKNHKKTIAIAILFAVLLMLPQLTGDYVSYVASLTGAFFVAALGLTILVGDTNQMSLGHAGFFAIGAYLAALLAAKLGIPFWLAILLSGFISGLIGVVVGIPALRLNHLTLAIATLAFYLVVEKFIRTLKGLTGGSMGMIVPPPTLGGISLASNKRYYYVILIVSTLAIILVRNLKRSKSGRALVATRDNEPAAQAMGINTNWYKVMAFSMSSFLAGIGGALFAQLLAFISPDHFTMMMNTNFYAMIVVGGLGSIFGAVLGTSFVIVLPEFLRNFKDAQVLVYGLAMIAILMFKQGGLVQIVSDIARWVDRLREKERVHGRQNLAKERDHVDSD